MARWRPAAVFAVVGLLGAAWSTESSAVRGDFVGSKKCGSCHTAELEIWSKGPHARAGDALERGASAACLPCHTTGSAPVGRVVERAVGCEACHGAGRGYAAEDIMKNPPLSLALGLRPLSTDAERRALCRSCHRVRTRIDIVDIDKVWREIRHGVGEQ